MRKVYKSRGTHDGAPVRGSLLLLRSLTAASCAAVAAAAAVLSPRFLLLFLGRRLHRARAPAAHFDVIQFPNVVVVRKQRLKLFAAAAASVMELMVSGVLLANDRVRIRVPLHARRMPVQFAFHEQTRFALDARLARHLVEPLLVRAVAATEHTTRGPLFSGDHVRGTPVWGEGGEAGPRRAEPIGDVPFVFIDSPPLNAPDFYRTAEWSKSVDFERRVRESVIGSRGFPIQLNQRFSNCGPRTHVYRRGPRP